MFAALIAVTIGSYIIVLHLRKYYTLVSTNVRLLAKSVSSTIDNDSEQDVVDSTENGGIEFEKFTLAVKWHLRFSLFI